MLGRLGSTRVGSSPLLRSIGKRRADCIEGRASKRARPEYGDTIQVTVALRVNDTIWRRFNELQFDERTFNVHEDILRTSEYFQDLFAKTPGKTRFDISNEEIDPDNFKLYIDWLYYGEIDFNDLNGNVGFLGRISSDAQSELKLDGAIVKRLCALALLSVTLDDASFRDYVLTQLRQRSTLQVAEYARMESQDAARLWTACTDSHSREWIEHWMFSHLSREGLNTARRDLPWALYESLLLRLPTTFQFFVWGPAVEQINVENGSKLHAQSALCRELVQSSSGDKGVWQLDLRGHEPATFRQYIGLVEHQRVSFEGYDESLAVHIDLSYNSLKNNGCRLIHFLCKLWLIAESMRDGSSRQDIMSALLSVEQRDEAVVSWATIKLISEKTKGASKLRSWLIDTLVSAAGTDNDWLLEKLAQLDPVLLSQLFIKSMTTLQSNISIPVAKEMRPRLKDLEKYLDE